MKYDLKTPCKNCPFRTDESAIRFRCRERAEEIEEQAYRNGFPCHLSAEHIEAEDDTLGEGGYYASESSQHCVGAIIMYLKSGEYTWPGIGNDEALGERLADQVDWDAPVFENETDFIEANDKEAAR